MTWKNVFLENFADKIILKEQLSKSTNPNIAAGLDKMIRKLVKTLASSINPIIMNVCMILSEELVAYWEG